MEKAVGKILHSQDDFEKILNDVQNPDSNKKKDKFTKKFALAVFNEDYKIAGLPNLPETKNDL